ncbi:MAG: gephyrin-like molybdotransferase Glp [Planctomycetota bacterium]|nr:gephyrin-like molybdotransferase Glp [Planctomycetota bacterium]
MLSVEEALEKILAVARQGTTERVHLRDAAGMTLAEDVSSDVDSPPHDKTLVDGYAVQSADFATRVVQEPGHRVELEVVEEITAGAVPTSRVTSGRAASIMTGAPIPEGADAVVMCEETEAIAEPGLPHGAVLFHNHQVRPGQNIMNRAASMRRGQVVLGSNTLLRPIEIGLLAEVGREHVVVHSRPSVAVMPTGNELVEPGIEPGPGRIRNSNGPMLAACGRRAGAAVVDLGIGRDDRGQLEQLARRGLEYDVLLICGGVSAGVLDLVPEVLTAIGVEQVFHKINMRPGKPLWFGLAPRAGASDRETLVFGLPGNPVSSFVCFELFVARAIAKLVGRSESQSPRLRAALGQPHQHRGPRPTYHPALVRWLDGAAIVEPLAWRGSSDLRSLTDANALVIFPGEDRQYDAGDLVDCELLR